MNSGVYTITSPSGKQYVGSAVNFKRRWYRHLCDLRKRKHHSVLLQRAFVKYGEASLIFAKVRLCRPEDLLIHEQRFLDKLKPIYNVYKIAGSPLGYKHTPETLKILKIIRRNQPKRKFSEEACENMSKAQLGKKHGPMSVEEKEKHRQANLNKKRTPEQIENIRQGQLQRSR